jgi:mitochondrial fusion and transport protein UGO1
MAVISSPKYLGSQRPLETIVDAGAYRGTLGTMWSIVREEGFSETVTSKSGARAGEKSHKPSERKGQGIEGLWRGWRVGIWGLIGVWGAAALGGASGSGGEF